MSRARKTVTVESIRDRCNTALKQPSLTEGERIAICVMLEAILHDANAYAGFYFVGTDGKRLPTLEAQEIDCDADGYHRRYYYPPRG